MAVFEKKLRSIANTVKDNFIKKYILEYFLEKITELTPILVKIKIINLKKSKIFRNNKKTLS